jgi:hypothetical protein
LEPFERRRLARSLPGQLLDRDRPVEPQVATAPNGGHPSAAEKSFGLVSTMQEPLGGHAD